jgi:hypothetical protein
MFPSVCADVFSVKGEEVDSSFDFNSSRSISIKCYSAIIVHQVERCGVRLLVSLLNSSAFREYRPAKPDVAGFSHLRLSVREVPGEWSCDFIPEAVARSLG